MKSLTLCIFVASIFLGLPTAVMGKPGGKGEGKPKPEPTPEITPMALESESYFFRIPEESGCLGEDDELTWRASGTLQPGEQFTFTPGVNGCSSHAAAITISARWANGDLLLESIVPGNDYSSWDAGQAGLPVVAPIHGSAAQLCMFPAFGADPSGYSITLSNPGNEPVTDIVLEGRHENDWLQFFYNRCLQADADGDGWNDSLEHSMANLVYPNAYIDGIYVPDILWGSNYLRALPATEGPDDEIDSIPPDLNDDGQIDSNDLVLLSDWSGQGNGVPLSQISPNPGVGFFHDNTLPWRRYDLDGDGWVDQVDERILTESVISGISAPNDEISPSARLTWPHDGEIVPRGQSVRITGHAWDNAAIDRVDYLVDGRTICSRTPELLSTEFESSLFSCWWDIPKRQRAYRLQIWVLDTNGLEYLSPGTTVQAR